MQFVEIAPDYFVNAAKVVQFRLLYLPERGGYCWVFTLEGGKNLFSIPFGDEEEARQWLAESFSGLSRLTERRRLEHREYDPTA
ncbi:MAG: hypothetical protein GXO08_01045 [Aquificae bacterium]|nr:hypothetical protein [Aquificota bacterium]